MKKTVSLLFLFLIVINVIIAVEVEEMPSELKEEALNMSEVGIKNDSGYIDTALDVVQGKQELTLTLKDSVGNYIYDDDCEETPNKYWYDLGISIIDSSGTTIVSNRYVYCVENYYLEPGDYKIKVSGTRNDEGPQIEQTRDITILNGKNLDYTFVVSGANLELTLKDTFDNYIYNGYGGFCDQSPSKGWYGLHIYIYDSSGNAIIFLESAGCVNNYYLEPGSYIIKVEGSSIKQTRDITIRNGQNSDYTFVFNGAYFDLTLKDSVGNYIQDRNNLDLCGHSPEKEWDDLELYIYNSFGDRIGYDPSVECVSTFYLKPGDYKIEVSGRRNNEGPSIEQTRDITIIDGHNSDYTFVFNGAYFDLTLKDSVGNYIYEGDCEETPSKDWYDLRVFTYNSSGNRWWDYDAECVNYYYLRPGDYKIQVNGKEDSYDRYISQNTSIIHIINQRACSMELNVETGRYKTECSAIPTCSDGIKNGDEIDIDCGGSCPNCINCNNREMDGDETGIDCGGSCPNYCFQLKILAVPLNWQGSQSEFNNAVDTQINFFTNAIPLKNCPGTIRVEKLDVSKYNLDTFIYNETYDGLDQIKPFVESKGINVKDYDHIIGFVYYPLWEDIAGFSNGKDVAWVVTWYGSKNVSTNAAHEIGHFYNLSDEYCSNQAGSDDPRCNDGHEWWWKWGNLPQRPIDINYLDPDLGCDSHVGKGCCSDCSKGNDPYDLDSDYFVCCEGNINSKGGRSIMSHGDADGPRDFDVHSKDYLAKFIKLKCPSKLTTEEIKTLIPGKIIDLNLKVFKNDSVKEEGIHLVDGTANVYNENGNYNLLINDINDNTLFNYTFSRYFDYDGPVFRGVDYSGIDRKSFGLSLKIPYDNKMDVLYLKHDNKVIFSEILDFCNQDGICSGSETYLSCWQDCKSYSKDGLCLNFEGDGCDLDCAKGIDIDCVPPDPVKLFSAKPKLFNNGHGIKIMWNATDDGTADYYQVQYKKAGETWKFLTRKRLVEKNWINHLGNIKFGSYTECLPSGQIYYYRVRVHNPGGFSKWSNVVMGVVEDYDNLPDPVKLFSAKPKLFNSGHGIKIIWNATDDTTADYYQVQYKKAGETWKFLTRKRLVENNWINHLGNIKFGSYTECLPSGQIYYYRVRVHNPGGFSKWSNVVMGIVEDYKSGS